MTGAKPTLGDRYARLGTWGTVAFIFYYCFTGLFLLLFLFFAAAAPLFIPAALLLTATAALFWRVDRLAFGLGIASLVAELSISLLILLILAMAGGLAATVGHWRSGLDPDGLELLVSFCAGLGLFLAVYGVLSTLFFVRFRRAFGVGEPRAQQERPEPPREDPWAL